MSLTLVACAALTGCGDGTTKSTVTGTVTYNSQPVKGGSVTLTPIAAGEDGPLMRPASGNVNPDGTFVLGTETTDDGASIGKHRVSYSPPDDSGERPEWDGTGEPPKVQPSEYAGLVPKVLEFEVKSGENVLPIELVPAPPPPEQ